MDELTKKALALHDEELRKILHDIDDLYDKFASITNHTDDITDLYRRLNTMRRRIEEVETDQNRVISDNLSLDKHIQHLKAENECLQAENDRLKAHNDNLHLHTAQLYREQRKLWTEPYYEDH